MHSLPGYRMYFWYTGEIPVLLAGRWGSLLGDRWNPLQGGDNSNYRRRDGSAQHEVGTLMEAPTVEGGYTLAFNGQPRRSGFQVFAPTYAMRSVGGVGKGASGGRIMTFGLPLSLKHPLYYDQDRKLKPYNPRSNALQKRPRAVHPVVRDFSEGARSWVLERSKQSYAAPGTVRFARNSDRFTQTSQTLVARATLGTEANQIWMSWIDSMSWLTSDGIGLR
ncbi:hypothetical protein BU15DRAFT_63020 [Melanogaster broomeanus]|nr:hypothetical protein BU15DRAFT_63020 [Melanogaster broomeanus]